MEKFTLVLLLFSLTENFLITFFLCSLLSIDNKNKKNFLMIISVTIVQLIIRSYPVSPVIIIAISLLLYTVYLISFQKIPYLLSAVSVGFSLLVYFNLENVLTPLTMGITGIASEQLIIPHLRFILFLPQTTVMLLLSIFLRSKKINLWQDLENYWLVDIKNIYNDDTELKKVKKLTNNVYLIIVFLVMLAVFITIFKANSWTVNSFNIAPFFLSESFLNFIILIMTITIIWLIKNMLGLVKEQQKDIIEKIEQKNNEKLDWELRMQNHDNNHHLGMINMMLKMRQVDSAREYLKGVVDELESIQFIINSGNKALNALIYSKMAYAKKNGVKLQVDLKNPLKESFLTDWDLNRLVGNLLDNAIEAVSQLSNIKREVELVIDSNQSYNSIKVLSHGVFISEEVKKIIFERGFTGKKEVGHGLGLAICKELIDMYNGRISVETNTEQGNTIFIIELPHKNRSKELDVGC